MQWISILIGLGWAVFMLYFALVSWREREPRAMKRALVMASLLPLPYVVAAWWGGTAVASILVALTILFGVILILPTGNRFPKEADTPHKRIDERDIMFARARLPVDSERFQTYYARHPEKKPLDDKFRSRPGLMSPDALYYDPLTTAAADGSFTAVTAFHALLNNPPSAAPAPDLQPDNTSDFLIGWAKKLGAVSAGIAKLEDYHLYSHLGRNEPYGAPIECDHAYAIAITVEMDKDLLDAAPYGPTLMESAQQYLNAGAIAVQIAAFIQRLGYEARAHIDGNYQVVCPLVARDAGLGEVGRMGLLMTPELGPRVRIAVVTTQIPLTPTPRQRDRTMIDFCVRCKKCADVCPSHSISFEDREEIDGVMRWQINSESCFTYWCTVGTDCGRCMRVCPYSHPNNFLHNTVRWGIRQSAVFREFALKMDDFFYGREPKPIAPPIWLRQPGVKQPKH
ncbi:MAG: 4Fe-4S dicluster domain-containing protein [Chloroflexi bacterium]|nr:4Fe-4S dicluster domain-containing protein [Chloroflexota bacterium]